MPDYPMDKKEYIIETEKLIYCDQYKKRPTSLERIVNSRDKKNAVLEERVIDILTENLGFGNCTLVLHNAGVVTVNDLISSTEEELLQIKGIGPKRINRIKSEIADYGFRLSRVSKHQLALKLG